MVQLVHRTATAARSHIDAAPAHRTARRSRPVRSALLGDDVVALHQAGLPSVTGYQSGTFSYAASVANPMARTGGRLVEALAGRGRLKRLYAKLLNDKVAGLAPAGTFWDQALDRMGVCVACDGLGHVPATGPLVAVANHAFGALDGIAVAHALGRVRGDVLVLAHEALARLPETRPHLLTVDFSGTPEAERHNVRARAAALAHVRGGGALLVFPAGAVMTTPGPFARKAQELPWGPLTARIVARAGAQVLPVFVPGQNGRLFQIASQVSQTLRYALLFRETARHIGSRITLRVGRPIAPETIAAWGRAGGPEAVTAALRARVFALADPAGAHGEAADELWLDPYLPAPAQGTA